MPRSKPPDISAVNLAEIERKVLARRFPEHALAFYRSPISSAYWYDPAEDGPEVEVITRILAAHPNLQERQ